MENLLDVLVFEAYEYLMCSFLTGDDGGGEDDDEEKLPSCGDYIMHFVTLFWKLLFAFVPPTGEIVCQVACLCIHCPLLTILRCSWGW
jgi:hypothetical protein